MKRLLPVVLVVSACAVLGAQSASKKSPAQILCEHKAVEDNSTCMRKALTDKDRMACKDGYKMRIEACSRKPGQAATH